MSHNGADIPRVLFHLRNQHLFDDALFIKVGGREGATAKATPKDTGAICRHQRIADDPKMRRPPKHWFLPGPDAHAHNQSEHPYGYTPQAAYPAILPLGHRTGLP